MLKPGIKIDLANPWQLRQGIKCIARSFRSGKQLGSQSGFTIIESLMAIVVAGILLVGLSPLVALYVGARVQARRIDLATQAARSYIDGLRSGAISAPASSNDVVQFTSINGSANDLGDAAKALTSPPSQITYPGTCLDKNLNTLSDNDCKDSTKAYLFIQALRDEPVSGQPQKGYCLGVRVYRADTLANTNTIMRERQDTTNFTANLGIGAKRYPLVVMKTEIVNQSSYDDYLNRFNVKDANGNVLKDNNGKVQQKPSPCK